MSDYSALDRLFHRTVLGMPVLGEMLFDLEKARHGSNLPEVTRPVFVTGLARAGTTILMRALFSSGQFASLTYADMPLVLAPNLWSGLRRSRSAGPAKERAHGDGILVDFEAPEALEEVFWRLKAAEGYIRPDGLWPHTPDAEDLADYRSYQALICKRYGKTRYLAKNNNLMLRLPAILDALPEATVLVLVRDPLAQAQSLFDQHRRFAASDRFTRDYMRWLAHHEFGADQRPYRLPGRAAPEGGPDELRYWLDQWIAAYSHLAEHLEAGASGLHPVVYEDITTDRAAWARVAALAGIDPVDPGFRPAARPAPDADAPAVDAGRLADARALYRRLQTMAAADPTPPT